MEPIITRQKTAYTVTRADGDTYTLDGHMYFSKALARDIAYVIRGMYDPCSNRTSVKEVVTGYTDAK